MAIASAFGKYGVTDVQGGVLPRQGQQKDGASAASSFASVLNQVSMSQEAKAKAQWSSRAAQPTVAQAVTERAGTFYLDKKMPPDSDRSAWLPENLERLAAIEKELDKMIAAEPDPITRSEATNQRLHELHGQLWVLDAVGERVPVTDEVMSEGVEAFNAVTQKAADIENKRYEAQQSLTKIFLNRMFGEPEAVKEREARLEEWQARQADFLI